MKIPQKQQDVLNLLSQHGPQSIVGLANLLGKSRGAVWNLVRSLRLTHKKVRIKEYIRKGAGPRLAVYEIGAGDCDSDRVRDRVIGWFKEYGVGTIKTIAIDLAEKEDTVTESVRWLRDRDQVHRSGHERSIGTGGPPFQVFKWGSGEDAILRPLTSRKQAALYRQRHRAAIKLRENSRSGTLTMWSQLGIK